MNLSHLLLPTEQQVDYTIEKMPEIVNKFRELSPFVAK